MRRSRVADSRNRVEHADARQETAPAIRTQICVWPTDDRGVVRLPWSISERRQEGRTT